MKNKLASIILIIASVAFWFPSGATAQTKQERDTLRRYFYANYPNDPVQLSLAGRSLFGNGNVVLDASTGTLVSTANLTTTGTLIQTSTASVAFATGASGSTNPVFSTVNSVTSQATGIAITGRAAAAGADITVTSSGTDEPLNIDAKGAGVVNINTTATGNINLKRATVASSSVKSTSPTAGIGYATGAGGAVTQATSRTTGVTLNTVSGTITLVSAAGSTTPATFTVTDSAVVATDTIIVNQKSGTDKYEIFVTAVGAGSFNITSFTTGGTTTEQPAFNFCVIKGINN